MSISDGWAARAARALTGNPPPAALAGEQPADWLAAERRRAEAVAAAAAGRSDVGTQRLAELAAESEATFARYAEAATAYRAVASAKPKLGKPVLEPRHHHTVLDCIPDALWARAGALAGEPLTVERRAAVAQLLWDAGEKAAARDIRSGNPPAMSPAGVAEVRRGFADRLAAKPS